MVPTLSNSILFRVHMECLSSPAPCLFTHTQMTLVWPVASLHYCLIAHAVDTLIGLLSVLKVYDLICILIWPCLALFQGITIFNSLHNVCTNKFTKWKRGDKHLIIFQSIKSLLGGNYIAKYHIIKYCIDIALRLEKILHFLSKFILHNDYQIKGWAKLSWLEEKKCQTN